jgi:hypothetical protein
MATRNHFTSSFYITINTIIYGYLHQIKLQVNMFRQTAYFSYTIYVRPSAALPLTCVLLTELSKIHLVNGKGSPYNRPWGPKRGSSGIAPPFREPRHEEGMGWLAPRPGRFTPGKETWYPLYRRLGGPQGPSGRLRKISPPPGFDPLTVQPVTSRYTDWAIAAHKYI